MVWWIRCLYYYCHYGGGCDGGNTGTVRVIRRMIPFLIAMFFLFICFIFQTYPDYECPAPSQQGSTYKENTKDKAEGYCERHGSEWFGGDGYIDTFVFWTFCSEVKPRLLLFQASSSCFLYKCVFVF